MLSFILSSTPLQQLKPRLYAMRRAVDGRSGESNPYADCASSSALQSLA
jgi:hypothetical protein